jgi:hypothetical protein
MQKKWIRILPWVALFTGILLVLLLVSALVFKPPRNTENTAINRKIAFEKLKQIQLESKEVMSSKGFFEYFDKVLECPEINTKWLIAENGIIIHANGLMAQSTPLNESIYSLADDNNRGLINAIEGNIDAVQKQLMYVAATIRREGDHNDIFGHLVMPLRTKSGELAGFMGVAYSLDNSKTPVQLYLISSAFVICFLLYWFSLPIWVYFDCREKNNKYILWTIFVIFGNIPAFIAYLIATKE